MPIPDSLRAELGIAEAAVVGGGCIHACHRVRIGTQLAFLKTNDAHHADAFAAEADGLCALREAGMRAPAPRRQGVVGGVAYLLLDFLELQPGGDYGALGRMLAAMHRVSAAQFGWHRANYIGATPQRNAWHADWAQFWLHERLRPQLELARGNGFAVREPDLARLQSHRPRPALLHGDLWHGNAGFTPQGPVLFDPAVYYGDREADLAMTELFGRFPRAFYHAYGEAFPLAEGYERRKPLYNLYHLLNHLNLFGAGYLAPVQATLAELG